MYINMDECTIDRKSRDFPNHIVLYDKNEHVLNVFPITFTNSMIKEAVKFANISYNTGHMDGRNEIIVATKKLFNL